MGGGGVVNLICDTSSLGKGPWRRTMIDQMQKKTIKKKKKKKKVHNTFSFSSFFDKVVWQSSTKQINTFSADNGFSTFKKLLKNCLLYRVLTEVMQHFKIEKLFFNMIFKNSNQGEA